MKRSKDSIRLFLLEITGNVTVIKISHYVQHHMEMVPPNSEEMAKFTEDSNIPTKKVKVQVRASQTLIFLAPSQQKVKV